jgi:hypothetical protein
MTADEAGIICHQGFRLPDGIKPLFRSPWAVCNKSKESGKRRLIGQYFFNGCPEKIVKEQL